MAHNHMKSLYEDLKDLGLVSDPKPAYSLIKFGRADASGNQLELAISADKSKVVLSERLSGNQVGMHRDEVIELMKLLGREFVLDALGDI